MKTLLTASMMCAKYAHLENEIQELENAGIDAFHIDIMDGTYVPNIGMGLQDTEYICQKSKVLSDVHLMIINPIKYIQKFCDLGADIIYVHSDAQDNIQECLELIRKNKKKAGLAISPDVKLADVVELFPLCDYLLVMTVYPGFAGQKYQSFVDEKLQEICNLKNKYQYQVIIDGACSPSVIEEKKKMGVDGFVLGTSALFNKSESYSKIISKLRTL